MYLRWDDGFKNKIVYPIIEFHVFDIILDSLHALVHQHPNILIFPQKVNGLNFWREAFNASSPTSGILERKLANYTIGLHIHGCDEALKACRQKLRPLYVYVGH